MHDTFPLISGKEKYYFGRCTIITCDLVAVFCSVIWQVSWLSIVIPAGLRKAETNTRGEMPEWREDRYGGAVKIKEYSFITSQKTKT